MTALKTISARIRGSKSDLEELGEDTEELANGFSKYADELKALTGVNIMVEGTTDQFKDLYEIMDAIAGVWGNLTDTQQARTAEILGGTRQLQVIASIISNWGDAERALVDAENSAGEAARANNIYMDTTTAHMNQFKAAFQDLSHTVIESDLLKAFVDLGTNLLNAANSVAKFIDSLGGIIPVLTAIAGLLMVFKADAITGLFTKVGGAIASFASSAVSALTTVTTVGVKGVTTLEMVEGAATAASTGFSSLVPVLGVVTFAIATLATTINQVKAKQAELREESIKLGEAAAKEGDELVDLADKYVDLAKTSSDNDAILEARNEIIDKLGLERSEVEGLIREYGNYEDAIRHATAEQLKAQRSTLVGGLNAAREGLTAENFGRYQDTRRVSWGNDNAQGNLDAIAALQNAGYLKGSSSTAKSGTFAYDFGDVSTYKDVLNVYQQLHSMMQLLVNDGNANTAVYQDIYNLYNEMGSAVNDYNTALQNLLTNELQQNYLNSQIPQTTAEYQSLRAEMIQAVMSASEFGLEMDEAVLAVDEFLSTQSDLSQFASNIDNAFASIHDGAGALASVRSEFDGIKDIFDGVTESLKGINDVQALVADGFAVDVEKAMELAEAYPQILDSATVTADGQLLLNEEVVNSFISTKQGELNAAIEAKIAELEGDKALLLAKKDLAQAQLDMAQQVANGEAELTAAQLQNRLDNSNKVVQALIEMGISEADAYKAVYEAMSKNASIFDGNVADVASDIAANMASASSSMATGFNSNVVKMNNGMRILVGNAHQVAAAVSAMGKGEKSGAIGYTDGGGNGQSINTFGKQLTVRGFTGANVSYKANNLQVSGIIKQLETDISGYTSAIAAIEGQIAALNAIRNNANAKIAAGPSTSGSSGRGGSGGGGGGGGGGGSGSGSGSSEKEETWFEKQYKLHQHYLNMDQETTQDFLKWLEKAYKQAYKEGIITLDEYYKYEEEIYKSYQKIKDAAKSTFDALVDYRVKMLKTDRENQKKAINDQLNDLKDFYSKQKELLQKQADDEKYYDEQSEKRKDVNDIKAQIAQLQYDNSAWAAKRRAELYEQLAEAEKSLKDFEDDRALQEALDALDDAYNAEEERLNKEIEAIEDVLNDPEALYNQALQDIQNNTEDLFKAFLLFNKKYGDGDDESIIKMWEEAFKNSEAFKSIFGSYYNDTKIGNYTGYTPPTPPTNPQPPTSSGSSNSGSNSSSSSKPASKPAAPSLASGSTVQVKTSATHFSPKSGSVRMASFVPGGQYTVYQTSGNEVLIGRGGVYTGWIYRSDIVGYKKGTKNATPGLHRVNEEGTEAIFTSGTGDKYRMFSGGEKVLPAKATNFLYEFAMAGAEILDKMKGSASETFSNRGTINQPVTVTMGDIIINGDTNQATVSEIRRAQREQVNDVLKAFNRYQITLYRSAK